MTHRRTLTAALALAGCGLVAACGGSASPSATPSGTPAATAQASASPGGPVPQACTLVSQADAAQLSGDSSVSRIDSGSSGTSTESLCAYADTSSSPVATVTVAFESVPQGLSQAVLQAALQQAVRNSGGQAQPVSGIGDSAYTQVSSDSAAVVFAKGTVIGVIGVTSKARTGAQIDPDLETIARRLAGQI